MLVISGSLFMLRTGCAAGGSLKRRFQNGLQVLLETVSSDVLQRTPRSLQESLRDLAAPFVKTKPLAAAVERAVERAVQLLGDVVEHGRGGGGGEIVREQEQQQQLEHQAGLVPLVRNFFRAIHCLKDLGSAAASQASCNRWNRRRTRR